MRAGAHSESRSEDSSDKYFKIREWDAVQSKVHILTVAGFLKFAKMAKSGAN